MDRLARVDLEDEQRDILSGTAHGRDTSSMGTDWGTGVVERSLEQRVDSPGDGIDIFDPPVMETDDHSATLGVGQRNHRCGEVLGRDTRGFPLEPLILIELEQFPADRSRRTGEC